MRATFSLLIFIAISFTGAADVFAQCRVHGVVLGTDGTPIAGATVRLDGEEYKKPLVAISGADGTYVFQDIRAGTRVRLVALQGDRPIAVAYPLVSLWEEKVDLQQRAASTTAASTSDVRATDGPSGAVVGVVRTADGTIVPGARVAIARTILAVNADAAGRYAFGALRSSMHLDLIASAPGFEEASQTVVVPENGRVTSDFSLAASTSLAASGDAEDLDRVDAAATAPSSVPGFALSDVTRGLHFLPAVSATLEAIEEFHVRGATPGETLVTADGYTIYPFVHPFGRLTPFDADAVQHAAFSADTSDTVFGGRLGGVLHLQGPRTPPASASGYVEASMLGLRGGLTVPVGQRGSIFLAARQSPPASLYNRALDLFAGGAGESARERVARFSGGTFASTPESTFRDLNVRADFGISKADRLTVSLYDGRDDVNNAHDLRPPSLSAPFDEPSAFALPADAVVEASDVRTWKGRAAGATWARQWSPAVSTTVSFGRSEYASGRDRSWLLTSPSTKIDYSVAAGRGGSNAVSDDNDLTDTTARASGTVLLGFGHALSVGAEVSSIDANYSLSEELVTTRSGMPAASQLVRLFDRTASGRLSTVFAQDVWRPLVRLTIAPGARVTNYDLTGTTYFDPRLRGTFQLTPFLRAVGGWSIDHQMAHRITREDLVHGDTAFWALADGRSIPVARAQQVSAGGIIEMGGLLVDVQGYRRELEDLTMFAPRRYPGIAPLAGASFLPVGTGTARGVDALARFNSPRNTFWTSYALAEVEYAYPTLEAAAFPASHAPRHEFKVADTVRFGGGWGVSGAIVVDSGRPYTAAESIGPVWFPTGASVNDITFGAKNSARLDPYYRIDASAQRTFRVARAFATLGVTVFNVLDRDNVWYTDYQAAGDEVAINDVLLMGRAVNVVLRVGF